MSRRLAAFVLSVCAVFTITPLTRGQSQSAPRVQGIVLEVSVIEMAEAPADAIEYLEKTKDQVARLVNEGKARLISNLHVRTRTGESFHARVGQRVPIQTGSLPVFQPIDRMREPVQPQRASLAVPQIEYENTGLSIEGGLIATSDGLIDIKLNLEVTGLDRSTGSLTPTFTQRTLTDVVRMRISETAVVMGLTQPEQPASPDPARGTGGTKLSPGSFLVILTTKPVN